MKLIKAGKFLLVVLFIVFLGTQLYTEPDSKADFATVEQATIANIDMSTMTKQDNLGIKKFLGLSPEEFANIAYYKSNDTMKAAEVVIIQFANNSQSSVFESAIQSRISDQKNVFEGYIQSEDDFLNNAKIDIETNYAIYAVGENAETMVTQFKEAL